MALETATREAVTAARSASRPTSTSRKGPTAATVRTAPRRAPGSRSPRGPERFRLLDGSGVSEYRWTPPGHSEPHLEFTFCRSCGIRTFARGEIESLGGTFHAIRVPTLDSHLEQFASIPVRYLDGRNDRYDQAPEHPEAIKRRGRERAYLRSVTTRKVTWRRLRRRSISSASSPSALCVHAIEQARTSTEQGVDEVRGAIR